ncbi:hypothetical protein HED54_05800 [Ochrobactrum anthropi ATCC 49188]|nr:hypothetical protein [Brucella anthropi ATCC 49188]SUA65441.1 Uncharacterised protein [Brucella anthropi]
MSGDDFDHAALLWLDGRDTLQIAGELHLPEKTIYENLFAIRQRAAELKELMKDAHPRNPKASSRKIEEI